MHRTGHILAALVLASAAAYAIERYYLALPGLLLAVGIAEAVFSSAIPDVVEPGGSVDHRRGAHSWRALLAVLIISGVGLWLLPASPWRYHPLFFLPFGYATHLLADALSPAGLPW